MLNNTISYMYFRFNQRKPLCTVTCNIKKDQKEKSKIDFVKVYKEWDIMRTKTYVLLF